jgi:ammonium transporter, Amt family
VLLGLHLAEASFQRRRCPGRVWVHGIGGLTGSLLAGVFATAAIGGSAGPIGGNPQQLLIQLYGVAVTLVWSGGVTFVLLKLVSAFVPLRVSREHELEGLDISQHGEALQ